MSCYFFKFPFYLNNFMKVFDFVLNFQGFCNKLDIEPIISD